MKAIIFDWGGVCCAEGEPFASPALQATLGLTPDEITAKVKGIHRDYYLGNHNRDSFWKAIMGHFGLEENLEINPTALSDAYLNSYEVYPDILDLIVRLKQNYKTGLLSDLTPEMKNQIQTKHDLGKFFQAQVYSCDPEVKLKKPDPKIFQIILEKMEMLPEESLFIDNLQRNIEAAAAIGMKTILFKDRPQFFKEIKEIIEI